MAGKPTQSCHCSADADQEAEKLPLALRIGIVSWPLAQGTSALTALVEIERWNEPAPPVRVLAPPQLAPPYDQADRPNKSAISEFERRAPRDRVGVKLLAEIPVITSVHLAQRGAADHREAGLHAVPVVLHGLDREASRLTSPAVISPEVADRRWVQTTFPCNAKANGPAAIRS